MNNLKEMKENLEFYIKEELNNEIELMCNLKSDIRTQLYFLPKTRNYIISVCTKNKGQTCVYKSKDLELALKEYWKIIGEEYE